MALQNDKSEINIFKNRQKYEFVLRFLKNQTKQCSNLSIYPCELFIKLVQKIHTSSLSMAIWTDWICGLSWDPSFMVTEVAMTGRDTPQARPSACLERTNTYGTFLSSQSSGRWRMISSGSASAAMTINSAMPLFRVLVAEERVHGQYVRKRTTGFLKMLGGVGGREMIAATG